MTTIDITSSNSVFEDFPKKEGGVYKISQNNEHKLYVTLDIRDRGGKRRGRFREIREFYIDEYNRILAGFKSTDETGHFYQYVIVGKLHILPEEAV
jgi:hypothetical protein